MSVIVVVKIEVDDWDEVLNDDINNSNSNHNNYRIRTVMRSVQTMRW